METSCQLSCPLRIVVSRIYEELSHQGKGNSEALEAQAQALETMYESQSRWDQRLLDIQQRIQGLEESHRGSPRGHGANDFHMEREITVAQLSEITEDLINIRYEQMTESVLSRRTGIDVYDSNCEEDVSQVGHQDSLEGTHLVSASNIQRIIPN